MQDVWITIAIVLNMRVPKGWNQTKNQCRDAREAKHNAVKFLERRLQEIRTESEEGMYQRTGRKKFGSGCVRYKRRSKWYS